MDVKLYPHFLICRNLMSSMSQSSAHSEPLSKTCQNCANSKVKCIRTDSQACNRYVYLTASTNILVCNALVDTYVHSWCCCQTSYKEKYYHWLTLLSPDASVLVKNAFTVRVVDDLMGHDRIGGANPLYTPVLIFHFH